MNIIFFFFCFRTEKQKKQKRNNVFPSTEIKITFWKESRILIPHCNFSMEWRNAFHTYTHKQWKTNRKKKLFKKRNCISFHWNMSPPPEITDTLYRGSIQKHTQMCRGEMNEIKIRQNCLCRWHRMCPVISSDNVSVNRRAHSIACILLNGELSRGERILFIGCLFLKCHLNLPRKKIWKKIKQKIEEIKKKKSIISSVNSNLAHNRDKREAE